MSIGSIGENGLLAASAVAASVTGTTSETVLATIRIPGGAMGKNGILRMRSFWSMTSSANNKTPRVRLGGIGGTAFQGPTLTTNSNVAADCTIQNRNSYASQVGGAVTNRATDTLQAVGTLVTGTVNTAADQTLVITGQLANSGETITLEAYMVELIAQI